MVKPGMIFRTLRDLDYRKFDGKLVPKGSQGTIIARCGLTTKVTLDMDQGLQREIMTDAIQVIDETFAYTTPVFAGEDQVDRTGVELTTAQIQSLIDAAVRAVELNDDYSLRVVARQIGIADPEPKQE